MDIRSLQTLIQVAELGSFTRAGEKLGYSQPTISFQIKQLERELGAQLFERVGHTVSLTDEGRSALAYAQHICLMSEEMLRGPENRQTPRGVIRLATADSLCAPLVAKGFQRFRTAYPQVSLHVQTAGTDELFRLLDHNEADVVCTLDNHIYNTNYIVVHEEKVGTHFVCSADSMLAKEETLSVRDLLDQPFFLTEKGMSYRRLLDERLARDSLEIRPVLEIGRADLICALLETGGISFLPDYVTAEAAAKGRIVRLPVEDVQIELWKQILYHRDKWMSRQMEAIIGHLSQDFLRLEPA